MLKKLKKFGKVIKFFLKDEDMLFIYLLEQKAYESLQDCYELDISTTEALEDLIFHIKTYKEIPEVVAELKYPEFKGMSCSEIIQKYKNKKLSTEELTSYGDYLVEVEKNRAVERDFIFEHAKNLTFGFKLD